MTECIIRFGNVRAELEGDILAKPIARKFLSFRPQGYVFSPAYKAHRWDGWKTLYRQDNTFPAGLAPDVAKHLMAAGYPTRLLDERGLPPEGHPEWFDGKGGATLDPHQIEAVRAVRRYTRGIVAQAVSSGKSVEIVEVARELAVPTLVVVSRKTLLAQQRSQFKTFGFDPHMMGVFGAGLWQPNTFTVGMVNTIASRLRKLETHGETMKALARFQAVLVDECHHLPSKSYEMLMAALPNAYYRVGFGGTPHKSGAALHENKLMVTGMTGGIISYHTPSDNIEAGRSVPADIYMVENAGADPDEIEGYKEWTDRDGVHHRQVKYSYPLAVKSGIVHNESRNALIASLAQAFGKKGPTVILAERIDHGKNLRELLLEAGHEEVE